MYVWLADVDKIWIRDNHKEDEIRLMDYRVNFYGFMKAERRNNL